MNADTPPPESAQDIKVRLQPLFGVEPKHYLGVIYALIVVLALFAVVLLPGLVHRGTLVTITSSPPGAAVTFGTKHWGTTPVTAFLPQGEAALTVSKPGFQPSTQTYRSGNALWLSWLFPRTDKVSVTLVAPAPDKLGDLYLAQWGQWALTVPFSTEYRFPPLYTRFAEDARAAGWDKDRIQQFLLGARASVADPQMYLDYGRALGLWGPKDSPPEALETQFSLWSPLVPDASDRLALWLLANQTKPIRDREVAEPSDWWKARVNGFQASLTDATTPRFGSPAGSLRTALGTFRGVPSATYLWGSTGTTFNLPTEPPFALPVPVSTGAFWIAESEVTQEQFSKFLAANPGWAPGAKDALIAAGKVDRDYLVGWTDAKAPQPAEPVVSVSWYAAQAFVQWANATAQPGSNRKYSLPDEFQWEAAARVPGGVPLLNQGVWEWTATPWYPGQSLVWNAAAASEANAFARSLKGGVQNSKGNIKAGDRAGWPAAGATPGLGFRLALVGTP